MTSNPSPYALPPEESKGLQQPSVGSAGYYPQQQHVVVQPAPTVVAQQPRQSFVLHIVLSCFVFWCCGCLCGLIAFILALVASGQTREPQSARSLGIASMAFSIIGIVVGIIAIIVIVALTVTGGTVTAECRYTINSVCYASRQMAISELGCTGGGYYHDNYCYYK